MLLKIWGMASFHLWHKAIFLLSSAYFSTVSFFSIPLILPLHPINVTPCLSLFLCFFQLILLHYFVSYCSIGFLSFQSFFFSFISVLLHVSSLFFSYLKPIFQGISMYLSLLFSLISSSITFMFLLTLVYSFPSFSLSFSFISFHISPFLFFLSNRSYHSSLSFSIFHLFLLPVPAYFKPFWTLLCVFNFFSYLSAST